MADIDPRIRAYFRINSAAIPLRSVAIVDARAHLDVWNADDGKKWLVPSTVGVVTTETVIGGADRRDKRIIVI